MAESPTLPDKLIRHLPAVVLALLGVSATFLVGYIGILALGIIWMVLIIVISAIYIAKGRLDLRTVTRDRDELARRLSESQTDKASPKDLNGRLVGLQDQMEAWKKTAIEHQNERFRVEQALGELQDKLDLVGLGTADEKNVLLATQLTCGEETVLPLIDEEEVPYDFAAKRLKRGTVIDVLAESDSRFAFYLYDADNFRRHEEGRRNREPTAGKGNITIYRERITIPHGGDWFFLVEPQTEGEALQVWLRVSLVKET
jgi:hypothetical protein